MTDREKVFREKAQTYLPCFSERCPLREHCLHALLRPYIPQDKFVTMSINLVSPKAETDQCQMYRSDQPVRMVAGLHAIYYDMPGRLERSIKQHLIYRYSRKRYYEYHNGTRPLPPEEEDYIRRLLKANGWKEELHFGGYVEEYICLC